MGCILLDIHAWRARTQTNLEIQISRVVDHTHFACCHRDDFKHPRIHRHAVWQRLFLRYGGSSWKISQCVHFQCIRTIWLHRRQHHPDHYFDCTDNQYAPTHIPPIYAIFSKQETEQLGTSPRRRKTPAKHIRRIRQAEHNAGTNRTGTTDTGKNSEQPRHCHCRQACGNGYC